MKVRVSSGSGFDTLSSVIGKLLLVAVPPVGKGKTLPVRYNIGWEHISSYRV